MSGHGGWVRCNARSMPHRARVWSDDRDLAAMGAPFARSIDGHRAHHDLQTSHAASATSREGITLSDGKGQ
jgi:hypothetical protein